MTHVNCTRCRLHRFRRSVVPGRGRMPAPVLAIGEAPGKTEDLWGEAFVGVSGLLLDQMVADAVKEARLRAVPRLHITNTVWCRPCDKPFGENRQPEPDEVLACMPHVTETIRLCRARLVVLLGDVAHRYYGAEFPDAVHLLHPSALLRGGGAVSPYYTLTVRALAAGLRRFNA